MATYIIAQLVGLIGYFFFISAPNFKQAKNVILVEAIACALFCVQWYLLDQYSLLVMNMSFVIVSMIALRAKSDPSMYKIMPYIFPIGIACILSVSKGTVIDVIVLTAFCLTVTSKFSTSHTRFRGFASASGALLTCSAALAHAWPAVLFNALFSYGHARKLGVISLNPYKKAA